MRWQLQRSSGDSVSFPRSGKTTYFSSSLIGESLWLGHWLFPSLAGKHLLRCYQYRKPQNSFIVYDSNLLRLFLMGLSRSDETGNGICWKMEHFFPMRVLLDLTAPVRWCSSEIPGLQSNILIKLPGFMSCFAKWTNYSGCNCATLFKEWFLSVWFIGLEPSLNHAELPISVGSLEFTRWWKWRSRSWAAGEGIKEWVFLFS